MPDDASAFHLSLWKKRLGRVPEWVWERTADNELSEIFSHIGHLKKLRMLDLGHYRLAQVQDAFSNLDGLHFLDEQPDRVAGIRQSSDVASGFGRSFAMLARASPEKQSTHVSAGVDCGTPTVGKPADPVARDPGYHARVPLTCE